MNEKVPEELGINSGFIEAMRERFEIHPGLVDSEWARYFTEETNGAAAPRVTSATVRQESRLVAEEDSARIPTAAKGARAFHLLLSHRARGHRIAQVDPLGTRPTYFAELDPAEYGFTDQDLDLELPMADLPGPPARTLRSMVQILRDTYCRSVGVEFMHIQDPEPRRWLIAQMEPGRNETELGTDERLWILERLAAAEGFESFLHRRFIGQKRFSLEGAESLIPLLGWLVEEAPQHGIREYVLGMAHRGRLNVLSNILGKSMESIFTEFEDLPDPESPFGPGASTSPSSSMETRRSRVREWSPKR
jgi:2-oxoglutarate dehydrogenase E1 component